MTQLNSLFLRKRLETLDLEYFDHPERLDRLVFEDGTEFDSDVEDKTAEDWVKRAEHWDNLPRRSVFIPDYFKLDEEVEEELKNYMEKDLQSPGLEGTILAANAIKAQKEKPAVNFSAVVGFKLNEYEGEPNINQLAGPYGPQLVDTPEWLKVDDWFSDLEEEQYVGVIVDDDTAYARHIMDNGLMVQTPDRKFDDIFWKAYAEQIESYAGWI